MKNKILKIIQIVYDILSLAFIVVVIVAMAVTPKSEGHHNDNVTEVVETKSSNSLYRPNGNQYYIEVTYLLSEEFNSHLFDYISSNWPDRAPYFNYHVWDNTLASNTTFTFLTEDTGSYSSYGLLYFNYQSGNFRPVFEYPTTTDTWRNQIFKLDITYFKTSDYFHEYTFQYYSLDYSTGQYRLELSYDIGIFAPRNDQNYYNIFGGFGWGYYNFNLSSYRWWWISTYAGDDLLYPTIQDIYNDYDTSFNDGYLKGLQEGKDAQKATDMNPSSDTYQYIYDLGKQEGIVEGMRGTESNAFIVIGQAFSAVGSIFSIEVLPNLPLWVLVFTPLIIVVVIVVVKLIKG